MFASAGELIVCSWFFSLKAYELLKITFWETQPSYSLSSFKSLLKDNQGKFLLWKSNFMWLTLLSQGVINRLMLDSGSCLIALWLFTYFTSHQCISLRSTWTFFWIKHLHHLLLVCQNSTDRWHSVDFFSFFFTWNSTFITPLQYSFEAQAVNKRWVEGKACCHEKKMLPGWLDAIMATIWWLWRKLDELRAVGCQWWERWLLCHCVSQFPTLTWEINQ